MAVVEIGSYKASGGLVSGFRWLLGCFGGWVLFKVLL